MDLVFRRATGHDGGLAIQLVDRALRDYGMTALPETADKELTDIERHYDARGGCFELVELDGEVVGVLGWRPADGDVFELKKLYLVAAARGRGVGRCAIERVIAAAQAAGARAVLLETSHRLTDANQLYRKLGFVPVDGCAAGAFATLSDQCDLAYRLDLAPPA